MYGARDAPSHVYPSLALIAELVRRGHRTTCRLVPAIGAAGTVEAMLAR
jgi:UDP:flavonoid glycosyltransferase YjiC (YdhE family)